MPSFLVSAFAIGGLIAALGPIVIHLLNRRRYRVIEWAAMVCGCGRDGWKLIARPFPCTHAEHLP